jgi:ATP-dependent exoDNAse (exonuclease V) beta subunit
MSHSILEKDVEIRFPQVTVLKASAGSGKTYSLTERFVQFLLSSKIPQNHLRNILAITFSNNAAKEMKERILSWLKDIYFGESDKIEALSEIVSLKKEHLPAKAGATIDEILGKKIGTHNICLRLVSLILQNLVEKVNAN